MRFNRKNSAQIFRRLGRTYDPAVSGLCALAANALPQIVAEAIRGAHPKIDDETQKAEITIDSSPTGQFVDVSTTVTIASETPDAGGFVYDHSAAQDIMDKIYKEVHEVVPVDGHSPGQVIRLRIIHNPDFFAVYRLVIRIPRLRSPLPKPPSAGPKKKPSNGGVAQKEPETSRK